MENTKGSPRVFDFLDVHHYLMKVYEHRKSTEKGFVYQKWASTLGISDRSYLRQIVIGERKLTSELARVFAEDLKLKGLSYEYFMLLTLYTGSRGSEREQVGKKLIQLLKTHESSEG